MKLFVIINWFYWNIQFQPKNLSQNENRERLYCFYRNIQSCVLKYVFLSAIICFLSWRGKYQILWVDSIVFLHISGIKENDNASILFFIRSKFCSGLPFPVLCKKEKEKNIVSTRSVTSKDFTVETVGMLD